MAIFTAFNAAGTGFNMTSTSSSGWSFMIADPGLYADLAYDDGSTAIYDIYGSAMVDEMKVKYWSNGYDVVLKSVLYKNDGYSILSITGLNLYTTTYDLESNAWFVTLNGGHDTFYGNDYADVIRAGAGHDAVYGYGGSDILYGDGGNDDLYGQSGNDDLYGGSGYDLLVGGSGSDYLSGGSSQDTLTGGTGEDYFAFDSKLSSSNVDRITDFKPSDDTIMLAGNIFTALDEGWLSAAAFNIGSRAKDSSDRILYDRSTGALYYDADGAGGFSAVKFAQLKAGLAVTSADFYVV